MPQTEFYPYNYVSHKSDEAEEDSSEAALLQKQLGVMEGEVKEIQMELDAIRRKRHDPILRKDPVVRYTETDALKDAKSFSEVIHIVHTENYTKGDVEVSRLREELIRAKNAADEERFQRLKYEGKLKDLELKINNIAGGNTVSEESKQLAEEVVSLKTQIRGMKEDEEELKISLNETSEQVQEYRMKYLQAQQQVEELKRQLDIMEFDNKQASDQIQIELQKMKMQFQEKLLELAPLPDLLKGAQIQLQEAKQLQKLAEESSQQISDELHRVKEKLVSSVNSLNQEKAENVKLIEENSILRSELEDRQHDLDERCKAMDEDKCHILRLEEKLSLQEARYKEKMNEYTHLAKDLQELKEESTRSITRARDRSESTRHYLQSQIAGLERQMIACRAQCRAYQKERDEIRQRMQIQIHGLKENFSLVEVRLRGLQGQVSLLKHCHSASLPEDIEKHTE